MSGDELGGRDIASVSLALTNVGDGLSKALDVRGAGDLALGDKVHLVVEATVAKVRFDLDRDNPDVVNEVVILRGGTIAIVDEEQARESLEAQRAAEDEATGKQRLPFEEAGDAALVPSGDVLVEDGCGVVLTEAEVAERRSAAEDRAAAKWFGQPDGAPSSEVESMVVDGVVVQTNYPIDEIEDLPTVDDLNDAGETVARVTKLIDLEDDVPALRRLAKAERQLHNGVGRKTVLAAIEARIAALGIDS